MKDGTEVPFGDGRFRRDVDVEYRTSPAGPQVSSGDFAVVTITVRTPSGRTVALRQLFTRVERRR